MASFTLDGLGVLIRFTIATNRGGASNSFICDLILEATPITSSSRCVWVDDMSLIMYYSSRGSSPPLLNIGDVLTLKNSVVKAKCPSSSISSCASLKYSPSMNVTITGPSLPSIPIVNIISPSSIGPCDSLVLDLSSSVGSGGRPFTEVQFDIESNSSSSSTSSLDSIRSYLNSEYSLSSSFVVPASYFAQGASYILKVRLCNFLGGCGSSIHAFNVSVVENFPIVSIYSLKDRKMKRKTMLLISSQAYSTICGGGQSTSDLDFSWKLEMLSPSPSLPSNSSRPAIIQSTSNDPRTFRLPPYSTAVGSSYRLTLTVRHLVSSQSSSASISIQVMQGDLVALISGSTHKVLNVDGMMVLDGSGSYDEDVESSENSLLYSFGCVQVEPTYNEDCLLDFMFDDPSSSSLSPSYSTSSLAKVSVKHSALPNITHSVHEVTLRVKSQSPPDNRISSTSVRVQIMPSESPVVSIMSLVGTRINPSQKLKLLGEVATPPGSSVFWSIDDGSVSLVDHSLSDLTRTFSVSNSPLSSGLGSVSVMMNLVLSPNTLPQQSTFVFTLKCELLSGYSSSSSIVITTNSPPLPGSYKVSPEVGGRMMDTDYLFVSSEWGDVDYDLPLTYEFSYQSSISASSGGSTTDYLVFRSRLEVPYTSSKLPGGASVMLPTRVRVFDSLDGRVEMFVSVEVLKVELSSSRVRDLLYSSLSASEGDVEEMRKWISLGSSVLNSVNCSLSPDCDELNRYPCGSTEGTCGECKAGYLGEMGDANSKCLSMVDSEIHLRTRRQLGDSDFKKRDIRVSSFSSPFNSTTVMRCTSDSDCPMDGWEECSLETGECVAKSKSCPNNCSNMGKCIFVSRHDWSRNVSECTLWDVDCESRCLCDSGYHGVSCNYNDSEYENVVETRHMLVEGLSRVSDLQDASVTNVLSWLVGLSSMSSDPRLLRADTKMRIAELSLRYLELCVESGVSMEDLGVVGAILDLILDVATVPAASGDWNPTNSSSLSSSELVLSLLDSYNDFVQSDMVIGQKPVSVFNRLFRSSHYSLNLNSGNVLNDLHMAFSPPRSALEEFLDSPVHQALIPSDVLMGVDKVSVVESQFKSIKNRTDALLSVPMELRFDAPPCNSTNSSPSSCVTRIVLFGNKFALQVEYGGKTLSINNENDGVHYVEVECEAGNSLTKEMRCPDGHVVTLSCNGLSGVSRQRCPVHNISTLCVSLLDNQACNVISSSVEDGSVTCECSLRNTSIIGIGDVSGKHPSGSATVSFAVLGRSLTHQFVSTWLSADDMSASEVSNNLQVLFSIVIVSMLGGILMFVSLLLDKRDAKQDIATGRPMNKSTDVRSSTLLKSTSSFLQRTLSLTSAMNTQPRHRTHRKAMITHHTIGLREEKKIEEALPLVMRPIPLIEKCKNELKIYHRWLGVYFHYSPSYSRPLRVLSLWINIVTMLFIQSVLYNLADPDDGRCERQESMVDCLRVESSISNSPECMWTEDTKDGVTTGECSFRPIDNDFNRVLILAMLSGILSSPFSIFFQSLILFVLSADTKAPASKLSLKARVSALERIHTQSRNRNLIRNRFSKPQNQGLPKVLTEESLPRSLQEDFGLLLKRLRLYRKELSPKDLPEFDYAWGEVDDVHHGQRIHLNETLPDSSLIRRFVLTIMKFFSENPKSPAENMLLELGNVRKIVCREAKYFNDPSIDAESKRKRLNLLFVKDLLDGVSGMILYHKDRRDNDRKNEVEGWQKVLACVVLFVSSFGMLYYVYLFAMLQTASRQRAWFNSFQVWLFLEVVVISTGLVLVEHVLIPLWCLKEVQRVKRKIVSDILKYQNKLKSMKLLGGSMRGRSKFGGANGESAETGKENEDSRVEAEAADYDPRSFNAAEFLFPSYRIAQLYPQYSESKLILQYKTPWPKKSFKDGEKSIRKRYDTRFDFIPKTIGRVGVFVLSSLVQLPPSIQEVGLQMMLLTVCGYVVKFHVVLFEINPLLTCAPLLLVLTLVHLFFFSGRKVRDFYSPTFPLDESPNCEVESPQPQTPQSPPDTFTLDSQPAHEESLQNHNFSSDQISSVLWSSSSDSDVPSSHSDQLALDGDSHSDDSFSSSSSSSEESDLFHRSISWSS